MAGKEIHATTRPTSHGVIIEEDRLGKLHSTEI